MQIAFREQSIIICSHAEVARKRYKFDDEKHLFREEFDPTGEKKNWQIHHIIPLKLGGDSKWNNLVLLPRDIHARLHCIIDDQVNGFTVGKKAYIALPVVLECTL